MKCSIWPAQTHGAEPKRTVTRMKRARAVVFVARCAGAATAAYGAAHLPGLPEALWATMSAIIDVTMMKPEVAKRLVKKVFTSGWVNR